MPATPSASWPTHAATRACAGRRGRASQRWDSPGAPTPAAALSHGEQRQLEIAMALAGDPSLLLLDEPMAGMGAEESQRMIGFLRGLKGKRAMLLIEHDMDAVFQLADRITVLVYGRAIASGTPEEIRANPDVRQAYLGEEAA
jgi:branched-chain amino acid transport system ATP-binding protein